MPEIKACVVVLKLFTLTYAILVLFQIFLTSLIMLDEFYFYLSHFRRNIYLIISEIQCKENYVNQNFSNSMY